MVWSTRRRSGAVVLIGELVGMFSDTEHGMFDFVDLASANQNRPDHQAKHQERQNGGA